MSDRNKSSVGWSGFSGAGCPVLHLPSPESRPLPELQAPELTACVRTPGSPRPCVTFHALATIPALHHPSPVFFPPAFWPVFGCAPRLLHVLVPVLGTSAWMSLERGEFHASLGSTSTHRHLEEPGAVFGNGSCRGQSGSGDVRGAWAGRIPPSRGCRGRAVLSHRCSCTQDFQDVWPWIRCRGGDGFGVCFAMEFPSPA